MSGLLYVTRIFQGVRKWGRGGRALPRVFRTASCKPCGQHASERSIRSANLTHKCRVPSRFGHQTISWHLSFWSERRSQITRCDSSTCTCACPIVPVGGDAVRERNYWYLCVSGLYPEGTLVCHLLTVPRPNRPCIDRE